ncbi:hypothetical protein, partial [Aeromonas caviae]
MFLYDPEQYIEWLGYPSQGEFFHGVFSSPLLNEKKLHVPCAKTLKKLFSLNEPVKVTPQAEKFFHRLKECLVSLGVEPEYLEPSSEPILRVQFSARVKWPALFKVLRGILGKWKLTDRVLVNWLSPNTPPPSPCC